MDVFSGYCTTQAKVDCGDRKQLWRTDHSDRTSSSRARMSAPSSLLWDLRTTSNYRKVELKEDFLSLGDVLTRPAPHL